MYCEIKNEVHWVWSSRKASLDCMPQYKFKASEYLKMAKKPTKAEKKHMDRVSSMGCIVCVNLDLGETPAEIHHIGNGAVGMRSTNYEVIPLCHPHHRTGGYGVAVHQGRVQWESNFGTEQELLRQTNEWLNL